MLGTLGDIEYAADLWSTVVQYSVHTIVKHCVYTTVPPFKIGGTNTTLTLLLTGYLWSESTRNIGTKSPYCKFKEPRNRFRGIDSASLCNLGGRYDKYGNRTGQPVYIGWRNRFLGFLNVYKYGRRKWNQNKTVRK